MKSQILSAATVIGAVAMTLLATLPTSQGQATASGDDVAIAALITEVSAQQAVIAENQVKIDETIAQIAEEVRQARIFVARGGGAAKK